MEGMGSTQKTCVVLERSNEVMDLAHSVRGAVQTLSDRIGLGNDTPEVATKEAPIQNTVMANLGEIQDVLHEVSRRVDQF